MPSLDVTANLFLGRELTRAGVLDRPAMRRAARSRLEAVGVEIDVDQPVGELSVGRRQIVAIAKALTYASRILIMDEPTAALTAAEVERLFKVMREIAGARRRHRLYLAPARGGAARRRPGDRHARRSDRRRRLAERAAVGTGAAPGRPAARRALSAPRRRDSGGRVLHLEHARFAPQDASAPAGRRRSTSRSRCAPAKSSVSPASWAPAAPSS